MPNERSVRQNLGICGLSNRSTAQRGGTNVDVAIDPTGLILQELHQGFADARARKDWIERFSALPLLIPDRADHVNAAEIPNQAGSPQWRVALIIGSVVLETPIYYPYRSLPLH
jgi:hypothetical protein